MKKTLGPHQGLSRKVRYDLTFAITILALVLSPFLVNLSSASALSSLATTPNHGSISGGETVTVANGTKVRFTQVAAGYGYSLALGSDGIVYSWGNNDYGQLGDGTTESRSIPKPITTDGTPMEGKTITQVTAGNGYSLALASDGTIYSWGSNIYGSVTPHVTGSSSTYSNWHNSDTIATSSATKQGDLVVIVGYVEPANEQTSSATYGTLTVPSGVTLAPGFPINTDDATMATTKTHRMYVWYYYATADGSQNLTFTSTETFWLGLSATTISGGPTSGNPFADMPATNTSSVSATGVTSTPDVSLDLGGANSLVLWAYGDWSSGINAVPNGYTASTGSPGRTGQPNVAYRFYSDSGSTGSITFPMGDARDGMTAALLSIRRPPALPAAVSTAGTPMEGKTITQISAGDNHVLALASDGTVYAWGNRDLGDGTWNGSSTPVAVTTAGTPMEGKTITQVAAGSGHSLALDSDGVVYAWGNANFGQLGNGTTTGPLVPVAVTTAGTPMEGKTITQVAVGGRCNLVLASDGTVYAWGGYGDGRLGNGTTTGSLLPVAVTTAGTPMEGKTITEIGGGEWHMVALASDGTLYSWGWNGDGQLGNGTTTLSLVPVAVTIAGTPMEGKTITEIAIGSYHALTLTSNGQVYSWGWNDYGQLGNGATASRSVPVAVTMPADRVPTSVTVGGVAATNLVVSGSDISFTAPAHIAGPVDIVVSYADGGNDTVIPAGYHYIATNDSKTTDTTPLAPDTGIYPHKTYSVAIVSAGMVGSVLLLAAAWKFYRHRAS